VQTWKQLEPQLETWTLSKSTRVLMSGSLPTLPPDHIPTTPGPSGAPEVSVQSAMVHHSPAQSR
jgi:hypothetical protein